MKERLDRRRKLKEKQHAKEIKEETNAAEKATNAEFDQKSKAFIEDNKQAQQAKIQEVLKNPDYAMQREQVRNVEKEHEHLKKTGLDNLEKEKQERLDAQRKAILNKFTMGAKDEAEMRAELRDLMEGKFSNYDQMMQQAEQEKQQQGDGLQERLRKRRQLNAEKMKAKEAEIEDEFANMDIEQIVEQEKAADAAQEAMEQEKADMAVTNAATAYGNLNNVSAD